MGPAALAYEVAVTPPVWQSWRAVERQCVSISSAGGPD